MTIRRAGVLAGSNLYVSIGVLLLAVGSASAEVGVSESSGAAQASVGSPGFGVDLQAGVIWNMPSATSYTGSYAEGQRGIPVWPEPALGFGPGVSVFGWDFWNDGSPFGIKFGVFGGTPGGGLLYEDYDLVYYWTRK